MTTKKKKGGGKRCLFVFHELPGVGAGVGEGVGAGVGLGVGAGVGLGVIVTHEGTLTTLDCPLIPVYEGSRVS